MNRYGLICRNIYENADITQRGLASALNISLGSVNRLVSGCIEQGLIQNASECGKYTLTEAGLAYLEQFKVDGAVIMAAGFGVRFVPLTFETPKGLLDVFGERMIERQIRQLQEAGITDITIVVGYLKEKFEYLIDKYDVKLLYNPEYAAKNTLATFYHSRELFRGRNMYLLVSDNWLRNNMYHRYECIPWYSAAYMEGDTSEWCLTFNKKGRITNVAIGGRDSWVMYGPAFLSSSFSDTFLPILEREYKRPGTEKFFWEQVVLEHVDELELYLNMQPAHQVYEFENLEELREFDPKYRNHSDNETMQLVSTVFDAKESEIRNIRNLKAGMTNQSFLFELRGVNYICRIPGPGTERLINRLQEEEVYRAVAPLDITEHIVYFNGSSGYKIAEYYEGARNSDPRKPEEVKTCMKLLKSLHQANIQVPHRFEFREKIQYYEQLCSHQEELLFEDYTAALKKMNHLLDCLDQLNRPCSLSHIDSVPDNFLILPDGTFRLIDWEYAAMHDPLIDVSMYGIYSYYSEEEFEQLILLYLERQPTEEERFVIYAYAALGGFLWTLWTVFKGLEGEEFGDYSIVMYRYAKLFYKKILKELPEFMEKNLQNTP